jgi:hypothetical protein
MRIITPSEPSQRVLELPPDTVPTHLNSMVVLPVFGSAW